MDRTARTRALRRFFRTPKGLLIAVLTALTAVAVPSVGLGRAAPGLAAALAAGALIDIPVLRLRDGEWAIPDGALLTGWIVALVLSPFEPWYVPALTTAIALATKHVLRIRTTNIFNPAAAALVITYYAFDTAESWWGALPESSPLLIVVLIALGVFITDRVNKIPLVLAFLGSYFVLFTVTAWFADPGTVAEVYRAPDLHAALFFAFFMLTDPPTSPPKARDQLVYGLIAGVGAYVFFELVGAVYFLLAGLLLANGWEAWRRVRQRSASESRRALAGT